MNKLKLYAYACRHKHFEFDNDPITKLITNIKEVITIYKNYPNESKKFFYFSAKKIHKLFYDKDYVHDVDKKDLYQKNNEIDLSELFYFQLLIKDEPEIINYKYTIDYIFEINNKMFNNSNEDSIKDLIVSKIIVDLIYNYLNDDNNESEEEEQNKLLDLKEKKIDIIKKILDQNDIAKNLEQKNNEKYTYNEILEMNVDEIYADIINLLIKNNYFSDYSKTKNILEELNLESIALTKEMYKNIKEVLVENNEYLVNYEIDESPTEEKINFYYLLKKYILKNSLFIYNIPFLKRNCLNIIKFYKIKKKDEKYLKSQNLLIDKIRFIIEYPNEEVSFINNNISNTKKNDYKINIDLAKKILNGVTIILMHDKSQEEKSIYKIKDIILNNGNSLDNLMGKTGEEYLNYILTNIEKETKDKKDTILKNFKLLLNFINDIKDYIAQNELYLKPDIYLYLEKASNNNNIIIPLDDFTDTSDKNKDVYDITCTSSFEVEKKENNESEKSKIYKFIDFNVLINGIDEEPFGFEHLINELTNNDYKVDTE